jgi:putative methionine-R-sulfoxide reductase with GAF domain
MNNPKISLPNNAPSAESDAQIQEASLLGWVVLVAGTIATLFFIVLAIWTQTWQMTVAVIPLLVFEVALLVSRRLIRDGKTVLAIWIMIAGVHLIIFAGLFLIAGVGVLYAIVLVALVFAIATPLSAAHRLRAFFISLGGAVVCLASDLIGLNYRLAMPQAVTVFVPMITAAVVLMVVFFVARRSWSGGLRGKLIIAFLAVAIIPLVIISYITYNSSRTALTNAANEKLQEAASQAALELDEFITFNLEVIRTAGKYPAVVEYASLPAAQRKGSPEEARAIQLITAMSRQDPVFISSVAIFDAKGISLLDTTAADIGLDKSSRTYFKNTLASGLPYVSDVEYSSTSGAASLYFAAPIRNAAGKVLGIIRIRYFASILQQYIVKHTGDAGETSYAVLLDPNHIRLAHGANRERVFKSIVPLAPDVLKNLQDKGLMPPGAPEELATNLTDFEAGLNNLENEPFFASDTDGDGVLDQSAVARMTTKPWLVTFIQDESVFLAPIAAQTTNNILVAVVIAVLVGVVGLIFSQTLSGPVTRLTQVAEKIAGGDINIQAKVETADEIGALATTFNRMTQQLRDFIVSLEERVAARTKDLATVAEVGTATATILESDKLLREVVELTKERFSLYHSHIYLLDEKGENLVLAAGAGEPGRIMAAEKRSIPLSREQSLVARAARERKGVTVNDVTQAPDFLPNPLLPDTRSELAVPMIVGGNVIGVFDIQSDQVGRFTDSDINIQTTLAAQVATSIQNVRSFEQSKAQADLETLVNTIGQKIQRSTTVEETLQIAVRELGVALGAARVSANIQPSRGSDKDFTSN